MRHGIFGFADEIGVVDLRAHLEGVESVLSVLQGHPEVCLLGLEKSSL